MDKITLVKMLLASQEENRKLHDKLDKISEEAKEREAKMQRQLNKTNDQYADLLVELKRQKDLNKQARKDKYDTTK